MHLLHTVWPFPGLRTVTSSHMALTIITKMRPTSRATAPVCILDHRCWWSSASLAVIAPCPCLRCFVVCVAHQIITKYTATQVFLSLSLSSSLPLALSFFLFFLYFSLRLSSLYIHPSLFHFFFFLLLSLLPLFYSMCVQIGNCVSLPYPRSQSLCLCLCCVCMCVCVDITVAVAVTNEHTSSHTFADSIDSVTSEG